MLELGICEADVEIQIENEEDDESLNARIYRFSDDGLESVYHILNRYPFKVTKWKDTRVEGEIDAGQPGVLFMSIPYDKGWTLKVDGIEREPGKIFDTFLSVEITEGRHKVELSYEPEGLRTGALITGVSILCLVGIFLLGRRRKMKDPEEEELPGDGELYRNDELPEDELWKDIDMEIMEEKEREL